MIHKRKRPCHKSYRSCKEHTLLSNDSEWWRWISRSWKGLAWL